MESANALAASASSAISTRPATHAVVTPPILYVGTPVVLISTCNADGSVNLAPMSSAWWLGMGCMLGLDASSRTTENLIRTGECVLNLPSASQADAVDRIAMTTGSNPVPRHKQVMGFEYLHDKFGHANLTAMKSEIVQAPRAAECPLQLEAVLERAHPFGETNEGVPIPMQCFELKIVRVHAAKEILVDGHANRIDPDKWKPLVMSFRQFYTLGARIRPSRLSEFPEEMFRGRCSPRSVPPSV